MKVYIGYETYYNYCDVFETVVKVFDDEVKALVWVDDFKPTEQESRYYKEIEVE